MFRKAIAISFLATLATTASADAINLSSWNELTLDFPGGQNAGDWVLAGDNESVTQIVNADPSFYLNGLNQTTFTMDGTWQVLTGSDDDYMGFVFGYQNSSNFYLFDWKKNNQGYAGTYAYEGMTVKKMEGSTGNGLTDLSLAEFWENGSDYGDMSVLATNHGGTKGWVSGVLYDFHLDFNQTAGEFNIVVKQGSTTLWDVTVADSTFTAGQFGFYNYSQEQVRYAGFTQTGGVIVPVPAPASLLLLAIGLLLAPRRSGT
ncbi:MAG: PEP-CTERM sorting domain-containing protein [Pseudomonadota bacterium]